MTKHPTFEAAAEAALEERDVTWRGHGQINAVVLEDPSTGEFFATVMSDWGMENLRADAERWGQEVSIVHRRVD